MKIQNCRMFSNITRESYYLQLLLLLICIKLALNYMWKSKTRVTSYELRIQIHELQVQIHELRVQIHELRVQIHE